MHSYWIRRRHFTATTAPDRSFGVRIAMLGLCELGINDPLGADRKKLIVFVEIDRCATDAIMIVTGCRVGRRSLKIVDNGKMAAARYPELSESAAQMKAYREMPDSDLFSVQEVSVTLKPEDMPGRPTGRALCAICGETILDKRDVQQNSMVLCRPCATGNTYYTVQAPPQPPRQEGVPL